MIERAFRQKFALLDSKGNFADPESAWVSATIDIDWPIFAISDENGHVGLANKKLSARFPLTDPDGAVTDPATAAITV